jgi:glycosyltransferase involved in cell wall biosynthesis
VHWEGVLGGEKKAQWLSRAKGLLFPVLWHEPFGLAVIEAFASGTPVLATPYGSLPELISPDVGRICQTEEDFIDGIGDLGSYQAIRCREWVMEKFHYHRMAKDYFRLYEKVSRSESLNRRIPKAIGELGSLMPIGHRLA